MQLYYSAPTGAAEIRFVYVEVETCLAIIAACGPSLKPLIVAWCPRLFKDTSKTKTPTKASMLKTNNTKIRHSNIPGRSQSFALRGLEKGGKREIRNESPNGSEEEIMTYHGIMRTREYTVKYGAEP